MVSKMRENGGPAMAPLNAAAVAAAAATREERGDEGWSHFDNSVSAVSFGFVATAILISMFLVMAIFERFLRPRSTILSSGDASATRRGSTADPQSQHRRSFAGKLDYPSPKMTIYSKGVSVLMPGHDIPTHIAHPTPAPALAPCPPERISWSSHRPTPMNDFSLSLN